MKHFTIPVFVPELACPNRCVFCNQHSISGCRQQPEPEEVREIVDKHLSTISFEDSHIEIGFFGGSFTGIELGLQEKYLSVAHAYLRAGKIRGIRLSTRPDYVNHEVLNLLKSYGVTTVELGAQSLDNEVLKLSGRGHTVADVEKASAMILSAGFKLGLQMMTGLPGDSPEKSIETARRIVELGANCTRIYPTLIIRGTDLEKRWQKGEYRPQTLDEAVELSAMLLQIFRHGGVEVIRLGLHPSEGLLDGSEMLAGPFHPSFRELVETFIWKQKLMPFIKQKSPGEPLSVVVAADELRYAIGYESANRLMLESYFGKVEFVVHNESAANKPLMVVDKKLPLPAKNALKAIGTLACLQTTDFVYSSISGHPDIFMCEGDEGLVVAPGFPESFVNEILRKGKAIFKGQLNPGKAYPESARYNAVVTPEFIIHNLKITDPVIFKSFPGRKHLHVNQGYTRCNLLVLNSNCFITSDRSIERVLLNERKQVLFVSPESVRLKGQKYGFFGGCCGLSGNEVLVAGSLDFHPQANEIRNFISINGLDIRELYKGALYDVGGLFVINGNPAMEQ